MSTTEQTEQTFTNYRTLLGGKLTEMHGLKDSRSIFTPTQVSDFLLDLWLALDSDEGVTRPELDDFGFVVVDIPAPVEASATA